jgi:hypothetical protein
MKQKLITRHETPHEKLNASEEDLDIPLLPPSSGSQLPDPNLPLHLDSEHLLQLTANNFVSARTIVLGQTGAGKGNAGALLCELLLSHGLPMTFIDPEGEAWPLKEIAKNMLVVGKSAHADREYAPEQMGRLAELSVEQGFSVILDLDEYSEAESYALVEPYLKSLWKICNRLRRPYHLVVDEVHEFVPQQGATPVKDLLIRIGKKGRKRGLGMLSMSQETASVDDRFLRQTDIRLLLRVTYPSDIKRYQTLLPAISNDTVEQEVPKLPDGKGYIIYQHRPVLAQLLLRRSFNPSDTPKLGRGTPEPALQQVDEATLHLLDTSLPIPSHPNLERLDRAALIEQIEHLTRTQRQAKSGRDTNAEQEQNNANAALAQQLCEVREVFSDLEQEQTQARKQADAVIHQQETLIARLQAEKAKLEKERERLEDQLSLATKLTVSLTGLPSVEALFPAPRSSRVEPAQIDQVTPGNDDTQRKTRSTKPSPADHTSKELRQLQKTLDALVQRVTQLAQQDTEAAQLQRDLVRLTQKTPSPPPEKKENRVTPLHPREQQKLDRLIQEVKHLPRAPFYCALVVFLLTHEGQEFSYTEIAGHLHYDVATVRVRKTTALLKKGLIAKASTVMGYTSRFSTYCSTRFPGVDEQVIREQLVQALAPIAEGKGA